jgi:hypothetical protein
LGPAENSSLTALPQEPISDPDFGNVLMAGIREQEAQRIALV